VPWCGFLPRGIHSPIYKNLKSSNHFFACLRKELDFSSLKRVQTSLENPNARTAGQLFDGKTTEKRVRDYT
jgi:hypothetical protein